MAEVCPVCGAVWGSEEIEAQSCYCCGYPDCDDEDLADLGMEAENV